MRAIHFMMIDYIKVKQQVYFMPLFLVIALLMWGAGILDSGTVFLYDVCGNHFFDGAFWCL